MTVSLGTFDSKELNNGRCYNVTAMPVMTAYQWQSPSGDLAQYFRAFSHPGRLDIVRLLSSGPLTCDEIGAFLNLTRAQVRRRLRELKKAGVIEIAGTGKGGRRYRLRNPDRSALKAYMSELLGDDSTSGSSGIRSGPAVSGPAPGDCLVCENGGFVQQVLDDLERRVSEAREYQLRLQMLSSQVLIAQEAERKRIARELHDDTAQALTSILVRLKLLERSVKEPEALQAVEALRSVAGATLDSVRRMAVDLRPAALDDLGLVSALRSYIERLSESSGLRINFSCRALQRRVPADIELVLYRVVQEALSNVLKHAGARKAEVSLVRRRNVVTARVLDDGRGFNVDEVSSSPESSLGLFGMQERLALVGGSLKVRSKLERGTLVTGSVPLVR